MLTRSAIARKALIACTLERTIRVDARGVLVAVVRVVETLLVICTRHAGPVKASAARARERTDRIGATGLRMTVVQIEGALVDVDTRNSENAAFVLIQIAGGGPISQQGLLRGACVPTLCVQDIVPRLDQLRHSLRPRQPLVRDTGLKSSSLISKEGIFSTSSSTPDSDFLQLMSKNPTSHRQSYWNKSLGYSQGPMPRFRLVRMFC
jgi:ribosomal protein S9